MPVKVVLLIWYSYQNFIFEKIELIFDLENWLWKCPIFAVSSLFLCTKYKNSLEYADFYAKISLILNAPAKYSITQRIIVDHLDRSSSSKSQYYVVITISRSKHVKSTYPVRIYTWWQSTHQGQSHWIHYDNFFVETTTK